MEEQDLDQFYNRSCEWTIFGRFAERRVWEVELGDMSCHILPSPVVPVSATFFRTLFCLPVHDRGVLADISDV